MPAIDIKLDVDGDSAWPDWNDKEIIHLGNGAPAIRVAALAGGMTSGRTSVTIGIDIGDNKVVIAETSLRLFLAVASALQTKYGDE